MAALLLDCWVLVDVLKRLRTLIEHTPGLKRSPRVEVFLARTANILDFRHYVQHLEGQAQEVSETGLPIWGTLSWAHLLPDKKIAVKMYAPGRLAVCKGIPVVNPKGREFHSNVDHIELSVNRQTVNVSEACRAALEFGERLEYAINKAEAEGVRDFNDLVRISVE